MKKLSLAFLSFLLALGLVEGIFRCFPQQPAFAHDWYFHSILGHTGPLSKEITEGGAPSKYNEWGFRNDFTQTPTARAGQKTILVLGDSMTEQNDQRREDLYVRYLRDYFQARLITLAAADFGTAEAYLALHLYKDQIEPDLILVQFLGLNDFVNNNYYFANRNSSWSDFSRPYFAPPYLSAKENYDGLPIVRANPIRHWLTNHSRMAHSYFAWKTSRKWQSLDFPKVECPPEVQMFLRNPTDEWKFTLEATKNLLAAIKRKAGKTKVVGVYFPINIEVTEKVWREGIEPQIKYCFPGQAYGKKLGEEKFFQLAKEAGLDLAFSVREKFEVKVPLEKRETTLFINGGHYTPIGHKLAAEAILDKIKAFAPLN